MTDERGVIREVAWRQVLPSTLFFSVWSIALNFRTLLFAVIGVVGTAAGWWLLGQFFQTPKDHPIALSVTPLVTAPTLTGAFSSDVSTWWMQSPIVRAWSDLAAPFMRVIDGPLHFKHIVFFTLGGLITLAVWAFAGGAITRLAAVEIAREEKLSWGSVLGYVRTKWPAYVMAPLFPLLGVLLLSIPLVILGLIMRAGGPGVMLAAILWPLVLIAGLAMAALLLGLFFGWPLMFATISTEGTDSFEALSRSYAYTFQRPLRYLAYVVVAGLVGFVLWMFVALFADSVIRFSHWAVECGAGSKWFGEVMADRAGGGLVGSGGKLIHFWDSLVALFATAFLFSYFWVAMTAVYMLLRLHVDAAELDEVYLGDTEPHGMPPLTTDVAGVTIVADAALDATGPTTSPEG